LPWYCLCGDDGIFGYPFNIAMALSLRRHSTLQWHSCRCSSMLPWCCLCGDAIFAKMPGVVFAECCLFKDAVFA
jgi:hypothetical protein